MNFDRKQNGSARADWGGGGGIVIPPKKAAATKKKIQTKKTPKPPKKPEPKQATTLPGSRCPVQSLEEREKLPYLQQRGGGSGEPPAPGRASDAPANGAEMPSQRGAKQVRRGGVWVGKRGPGGRGEMPPSARRRGGTATTAAARAAAPRRSRLPGLAAHPRALSSAQARRWDLQQSLQETAGPVIRQEIFALPDGQAGRVRVSARSFPRWALVLPERRRLKGRGWREQSCPGRGWEFVAPAAGRGQSGSPDLRRLRPRLPARSRRSVSPAVSAGAPGGPFGARRSGAYVCTICIYVSIILCNGLI